MHRMGDLLLMFAFARKLIEREPSRPLWVVAEKHFYDALLPLAPQVVFIPPFAEILQQTEFNEVINLSHRQESIHLASSLRYEKITGHYVKDEKYFVEGFWQLYRTSLTMNSRHNLFHWSDLNALDSLTYEEMLTVRYALPKKTEGKGRIGLFLGASSPTKRPDPLFFAELATIFVRLGYKPVFLGGKGEKELGKEVARITQLHSLNLVDRFQLKELTLFMQNLDLLITPDTGPMHLAAAFSVPTLTLSMGNVNPYETSVPNPQHHVLQARLSCTSCWECVRNYECKQRFTASSVALYARNLLENKQFTVDNSLALFSTHREDGLHKLKRLTSENFTTREYLDIYWQSFFLRISPSSFPDRENPLASLQENCPKIIPYLQKAHMQLFKEIVRTYKLSLQLNKDFWIYFPPLIRPLSSFLQMYLSNNLYAKQSYETVFSWLDSMLAKK